jgi:hypothetical protein
MQDLAIGGTDKAQQNAIKYGLAEPTEHRVSYCMQDSITA